MITFVVLLLSYEYVSTRTCFVSSFTCHSKVFLGPTAPRRLAGSIHHNLDSSTALGGIRGFRAWVRDTKVHTHINNVTSLLQFIILPLIACIKLWLKQKGFSFNSLLLLLILLFYVTLLHFDYHSLNHSFPMPWLHLTIHLNHLKGNDNKNSHPTTNHQLIMLIKLRERPTKTQRHHHQLPYPLKHFNMYWLTSINYYT